MSALLFRSQCVRPLVITEPMSVPISGPTSGPTHTPLPHSLVTTSQSAQLPGGRYTVEMSASVSLDEAINNFKDVVTTLDMTKSGMDHSFIPSHGIKFLNIL